LLEMRTSQFLEQIGLVVITTCIHQVYVHEFYILDETVDLAFAGLNLLCNFLVVLILVEFR